MMCPPWPWWEVEVGPPAHQPSALRLTVHITAQHGFLQWVHTALLQPLLDWGCVQADEVLGLTGQPIHQPLCVTPLPSLSPSPWWPQTVSFTPAICSLYLLSGTGKWGPYLTEGCVGGAFQGPAVAVQQLSSILDGLGDSVPFTKEAYEGRRRDTEGS